MLVRTQLDQELHQDQELQLELDQDQELRRIRSCIGSGAALELELNQELHQDQDQELRRIRSCIWSCIRSKSRISSIGGLKNWSRQRSRVEINA